MLVVFGIKKLPTRESRQCEGHEFCNSLQAILHERTEDSDEEVRPSYLTVLIVTIKYSL